MLFGEKVKHLRLLQRRTQADMAQEVGMSAPNYCAVEKGRVKPSQLLIKYLCVAYDLPEAWLIDDTNDDLKPLYKSDKILPLSERLSLLNEDDLDTVETLVNKLLEKY